jgi:chromosome segregation ATPase
MPIILTESIERPLTMPSQNLNKKIKDLENGRYKIEKKHKSELNLIGEQINNLDIQYNFLDHKDKENDTENKILKNKINELKNEQKINQKRLIDNQKQLDFLTNKSKEKDQEIKLLTMQLNSLRKITKYGNVDPAETEVDEYISKLKKEKENKIIKKNVTSHEQEIQANFDSESENN